MMQYPINLFFLMERLQTKWCLKNFYKSGLNTYTVTVLRFRYWGVSTNSTIEVKQSNFEDAEAVALTGGTSKKWYVSASEPGHLGVDRMMAMRLRIIFKLLPSGC
jgi:hypothetical protein